MFRTRNSTWPGSAVLTVTCLLLLVSIGWAQGKGEPADTLKFNYFSNANNKKGFDQEVRVTNPGAYAPHYPPSDICAMIYVFDNQQELKECCGCLISPDGLLSLSVNSDLTSNPFDGVRPVDGDVKIISAAENDSFGGVPCDPTGGGIGSNGKYELNIVPTPDIRAWGSHYQTDGKITEDEYQGGILSKGELSSLQEECYGVVTVGSGAGICAENVYNSSEICN